MKKALRVLTFVGLPFFIFSIMWFVWEVLIIGTPTYQDKVIEQKFATADSIKREIDRKQVIIDSMNIKVALGFKFLDSNRHYYNKAMEYKMKRDEMEILYLRTENDAYRIKGNRYGDLAYKYGMTANRWNDSLQLNAK